MGGTRFSRATSRPTPTSPTDSMTDATQPVRPSSCAGSPSAASTDGTVIVAPPGRRRCVVRTPGNRTEPEPAYVSPDVLKSTGTRPRAEGERHVQGYRGV